ncbi:MAG: hypothetical protein AAB660_02855 [Patescibacteria group bacterium]
MRANRLASFAAILATLSCSKGEDITSVRIPPPAVFFTSWTDTIGTCVNINDLNVGVPALDPGNVFAINRGDTVQTYVIQRFSPGACHPMRHFRMESMDTTVVTVRTIDSTTGRIMGISPGTRQFCVVDSALPSFRHCAFVTVRGGTTGGIPTVTISPRGLAIQTGSQCPLTRQFTATTTNPSGQGVAWSVNSSGSVISPTGLLTVPNGVSGSGYVKATTSSGAVDSTNFTLVGTSCGTGNPTPVSINAEPTNTTLGVNQTLALNAGGPYRVTVTYSDGSTKVNDMSVVTATSSDPLKVLVNATTGLVTALQVTTPGGGVILTYCATGTTICDTVFVSVSALPTISSSPQSVCFSTIAGSPVTQQLTISVTNANLADVRLTSNITGVSVSGSGASWTLTKAGGAGVANGNVVATLTSNSGVSYTIPVQIIANPCPGSTSTIDYSPPGGTSTGVDTLRATCVQGANVALPCEPFWFSSDPLRISVRGTTAKVVNGITFWVGTTAILTRTASTSGGSPVRIGIQWFLTDVTPSNSHDWVP